ncbi:MAG TPA: FIST N-terminal domain-containing protein [Patescibacteria group bacterium]|nr:FIST N-terminal domain-containing protein [Patescibacteria group bacterium]
MRIAQHHWTATEGWSGAPLDAADSVQLVLYFAASNVTAEACPEQALKALYPAAHILGGTTGGEILGIEVDDETVAAVAVHLEHGTVQVVQARISGPEQSHAVGEQLAHGLPLEGLRSVFVLADGMLTNGSTLIPGLRTVLPESVALTGGLAGDGARFQRTLVGLDGPAESGVVAAVGFYGERLTIGCGSVGGWERFGPERAITKSSANILYELDGEPALDLYKRYLGEEAANLPSSALFFPLTVRPPRDEKSAVVRTIVGVDEDAKAMIFAGDIPTGYVAQLMRGNFEELMDGAGRAGTAAAVASANSGTTLALLVSCIGRKLLLGQSTCDEVEAVAEALGPNAAIAGFYSYGEIAPHGFTGRCELHNQTMTVTTIGEA